MNWLKIKLIRLLILSLTVIFLTSTLPIERQGSLNEVHLKAVFIFNFTQFVEWPAKSFSDADAPLIINVLGDTDLSSYLKKVVNGESKGNHQIVVSDLETIDGLDGPNRGHILYVGKERSREFEKSITMAKANGILTVSDLPDFASKGGMIRFYLENGKMRIQINLKTAKAAELSISSKLLNIADVIQKGKN